MQTRNIPKTARSSRTFTRSVFIGGLLTRRLTKRYEAGAMVYICLQVCKWPLSKYFRPLNMTVKQPTKSNYSSHTMNQINLIGVSLEQIFI